MTMENNVEYIDFEKDRAKAREYAESVFSHSDEALVEEGHEFDYMRFHDGHTVLDLKEIEE